MPTERNRYRFHLDSEEYYRETRHDPAEVFSGISLVVAGLSL
jgi:hypothetical protein